jgi:hypothetical protein
MDSRSYSRTIRTSWRLTTLKDIHLQGHGTLPPWGLMSSSSQPLTQESFVISAAWLPLLRYRRQKTNDHLSDSNLLYSKSRIQESRCSPQARRQEGRPQACQEGRQEGHQETSQEGRQEGCYQELSLLWIVFSLNLIFSFAKLSFLSNKKFSSIIKS